ncbi:DUF1493 family protein [Mucilaginibacter sp. NFX135]|uniref:DUF1493 family protein n=1 Tax=Mucilaginibacter sp. NFX135 TaxID=3402687 RepID=UPI003AFB2E0B
MEKYNKELITYISKRSGIDEDEINYNSVIEDDLGITGDDAEELIIEFSKFFKVNIDNFRFNRYFYPEPSLFSSGEEDDKLPLTIGHLARSIILGRLDDSVIKSNQQ